MVEELEAMAIEENCPEDKPVKALRRTVRIWEDNLSKFEAGKETKEELQGSGEQILATTTAGEEGDGENNLRLSSQAALAEEGTDTMNDDEERSAG